MAKELLKLLSSKGVIGFLHTHNMAGLPYHYDRFEPLREFVYDWNKPEKEFILPELELAKLAMWRKADAYYDLMASDTYPSNRPDHHYVPPEWEYEKPERFWRVVNRFQSLAREIVTLHAEFSRTAKRLLIAAAPRSKDGASET